MGCPVDATEVGVAGVARGLVLERNGMRQIK
jgi:hypothetical protein